MRFIVLGAGSISQRHIRNLQLLGHEITAVFDPDSARLSELRGSLPNTFFTVDEDDALNRQADAALVCSPTVFHVRQARQAISKGLHVFIEKPLASTLDGTEALVAEAREFGRIILVGCNLRFSRSLNLVKNLLDEGRISQPLAVRANCGYYLPHWRPGTDYRQGYGARVETGGGIILDAIHEFDYLRWFFGEVNELFCYAGKLSTLEIDVEDNADVLLRFASSTVANLHLDYLQRTYRRSCEIIGEDGVIVWDYTSQQVSLLGKNDRHCEVFSGNINTELNEMYIEEMKHFVACIEQREQPALDAEGARAVLQIALAAKDSAARHEIVTLSK